MEVTRIKWFAYKLKLLLGQWHDSSLTFNCLYTYFFQMYSWFVPECTFKNRIFQLNVCLYEQFFTPDWSYLHWGQSYIILVNFLPFSLKYTHCPLQLHVTWVSRNTLCSQPVLNHPLRKNNITGVPKQHHSFSKLRSRI